MRGDAAAVDADDRIVLAEAARDCQRHDEAIPIQWVLEVYPVRAPIHNDASCAGAKGEGSSSMAHVSVLRSG